MPVDALLAHNVAGAAGPHVDVAAGAVVLHGGAYRRATPFRTYGGAGNHA